MARVELDRLPLGDDHALVVTADDDGVRAEPWLLVADRRAVPGDGAAEALLRLLADGSRRVGAFEVTAWTGAGLAGERGFGVDQTNESVVVGEQAVVKWMRAVEPGPHPAPALLDVLLREGFTGMPRPWGLVQWTAAGEPAPRLLVTVDTLVPGAVDGWTWAVDDLRTAVTTGATAALELSSARVGALVADLHAAAATTARPATPAEVAGWADTGAAALDHALAVTRGAEHELLTGHAEAVRRAVVPPAGLGGTPVLQVHGDLHVGQLLRAGDDLVVTDFDGNPVVPPEQRSRPQPAALDVAGMAQSLTHVAYVLRRHEPGHPADAVRSAREASVAAFLASYAARLADHDASWLLEPALVPALRLQQVCREFSYAATHLPRWSYVPTAALPDLLATTDARELP